MRTHLTIAGRRVGPGEPVFIVAEMSANHGQDESRAVEILEAAKDAGADAIKLQTYTADTITIDCDRPEFQISGGPWDGRTLHSLYGEAFTPWEWHGRLKQAAERLGLVLFSSPFDDTAVDFLEGLGMPAYKIASFEVVDLPLIRRVARTGRPIILSTGMATIEEIEEAVGTVRDAGGNELALLKCTSAYPAPPDEMNLRAIPALAEGLRLPVGISDHTLGPAVPVAAVALGATIIEKHLTLSRSITGPDSCFSLEPHEFKAMVEAVRATEKALGARAFGVAPSEAANRVFRRSLFVVRDVRAGEAFTAENVRAIRPGHGLHPRHLEQVVGRRAACDLRRGTPLAWSHVEKS